MILIWKVRNNIWGCVNYWRWSKLTRRGVFDRRRKRGKRRGKTKDSRWLSQAKADLRPWEQRKLKDFAFFSCLSLKFRNSIQSMCWVGNLVWPPYLNIALQNPINISLCPNYNEGTLLLLLLLGAKPPSTSILEFNVFFFFFFFFFFLSKASLSFSSLNSTVFLRLN